MKKAGLSKCVLLFSLALALQSTTGCSRGIDKQIGASRQFRNALSVSPFAEAMFRAGYSYEDGLGNKASDVAELQQLFVKHGANEVYARIATARKQYSLSFSDHSLQTGIERAKLAKSLGLPFNPEIGVFKYYGDVTGQPGPDFSEYPEIKIEKPWEQMTLEEMKAVLRQYGAIVAGELFAVGAEINVWNIGNEVNFGFAGVAVQPLPNAMDGEMGKDWYRAPDAVNPELGKQSVYSLLTMENSKLIPWIEKNVWPYQAELMNAVREGILTVDKKAKFSTHITYPANTEFTVAFFKAMLQHGLKLDVAGLSFYPSSTPDPQNRLEAFKNTVKAIGEETGLPVFIAEYAYPAYQEGYIPIGLYKDWNKKAGSYEMDDEGQARLLYDLASWGAANGVCGIRPWAPELVEFFWGEFSMFSVTDFTAKARPVLDAISRGLKGTETDALGDNNTGDF